MKKTILLFALTFICAGWLVAQAPCSVLTPNRADLKLTGTFANVHSQGNLFSAGSGISGLIPYFDSTISTTQATTIYDAGVWIGGIDQGGNLKFARQDYISSPQYSSYYPGPLDDQGLLIPDACAQWDQVFYVTSAQIAAHRADQADDGIVQNKQANIYGWAGKGNPHFAQYNGFSLPPLARSLAPFFDLDNDGNYNPDAGDFPCVWIGGFDAFVPAEITWTVFNARKPNQGFSNRLHFEFQLTAWAFGCTDFPELDHAVFTAHKVINLNGEPIDSVYMGIWTDFDLGCYTDDYMGSHPASNTFFAYNALATDAANCGGVSFPNFGTNPPVQAATFLNRPMFSYLPSSTSLSNGSSPAATYNALTGTWFDGVPITPGGTGYNPGNTTNITKFAFAGDPRDASQWSMRSANIPLDDFLGVATVEFGQCLPGQVEEVVMVWSAHNGGGDHLSNYQSMLDGVADIQQLYDAKFAGVCGTNLSDASEPDLPIYSVHPNPASTFLQIDWQDAMSGQLSIFDALGRLVMSPMITAQSSQISIAHLPSGNYMLRAEGFAPVKWVKI
jgi:Secretion system C-terminal sorting domain